jgi:hypothetical protein
MSGPLAIVELTRDMGLAFTAASWPFVISDALSKTVDIVDLKSKLDLCEARHMAIVIKVVEESLAPLIGTDLQSVDADFEFDPTDDLGLLPIPQNLSDTAKNALGLALRRCDKILVKIYEVRHVPEQVGVLNRRVYGCTVAVALLATVTAVLGILWPDMPHWLAWVLLASLGMSFLTTGFFAVNRQRQVHNAAQTIVNEDPQPRA